MKCAVIGANGYLGIHLSTYLSNKGFHVFNYDIQQSSDLPNYYTLDVCNHEAFEAMPENLDKIYFFAGVSGTHISLEKPALFLNVNEVGLLNMLTFLVKRSPLSHLIFPSTRLVYKGSEEAIKEENEKDAKTVYALNKLTAENYLKIFSNYYGINYTVYRIGVPYGNKIKKEYSYGTIGIFLKQIKENGIINLFGAGELRRTFTYVEDICFQIVKSSLLKKSKNQVFNIDGEDFSLFEIANMMSNRYGGEIEFRDWKNEDLLIESGNTVFDSEKIKALLKRTLHYTLNDWLETIKL